MRLSRQLRNSRSTLFRVSWLFQCGFNLGFPEMTSLWTYLIRLTRHPDHFLYDFPLPHDHSFNHVGWRMTEILIDALGLPPSVFKSIAKYKKFRMIQVVPLRYKCLFGCLYRMLNRSVYMCILESLLSSNGRKEVSCNFQLSCKLQSRNQ